MWMGRSWSIRSVVAKARIQTAAIPETGIMGIRLCAHKLQMSGIPPIATRTRTVLDVWEGPIA